MFCNINNNNNDNILSNNILFLDNNKQLNSNYAIISDIFSIIDNRESKLYIVLINANYNSIESISIILENYYQYINKLILDNFLKFKVEVNILLPELYYINNSNNNNSTNLINSINLIINKIPNPINYIILPSNSKSLNSFIIKSTLNLKLNYFEIKNSIQDQSDEFIANYDSNIHSKLQKFNSIYCGGFYDYLHCGHKYFLSLGSLLAKNKFFVSVLQKSSIIQQQQQQQQINSINNSEDITPPSSPRNNNHCTAIKSNSVPNLYNHNSNKCPFSNSNLDEFKLQPSKSSIGEIKNLIYNYSDKKNDEYMQPVEKRIQLVSEFLNLFNPNHSDIEVISNTRCSDINFCPMTYYDQVDALLLIDETIESANKINSIRLQRNLSPLSIYVVKQLKCFHSNRKISSSFIRNAINNINNNK